jgi:heme/copper-type cytochrome/quinol oxidase subunit 4
MIIALIFLVLIAAAAWAVSRSASKLKIAAVALGIMMISGAITFVLVFRSFPHVDHGTRGEGINEAVSLGVALAVSLIAGSIAALIAASKYQKNLHMEAGH